MKPTDGSAPDCSHTHRHFLPTVGGACRLNMGP